MQSAPITQLPLHHRGGSLLNISLKTCKYTRHFPPLSPTSVPRSLLESGRISLRDRLEGVIRKTEGNETGTK